jgi:hypothetical protein
MREFTVQLASRIDDGESIMMIMIAKARYFQSEEGAVYTSLRPEEAAVIARSTYCEWLVKAADGMLNRIDSQEKSLSLEKSVESLRAGGIPEHLCESILLANEHYGEIDLETYRLNIMQTLDIAENRMPSAATSVSTPQGSLDVGGNESQNAGESDNESPDLNQVILDLIARLDQGEGVDFDTLLSNAAARGHDRDAAEASLDELSEQGTVHEPRFGWFKITV